MTKKQTIESLAKEIREIKATNASVEQDKAWEISKTRRLTIAFLTYVIISLFFWVAQLPEPFVNALVPTAGFVLSTLALPYVRCMWQKL
ncbi:MAG: hypothetical protein ACI8Y7_000976 [Candidatus Woesearchaeota archaeon]|jgi:hypothetical protein